MIFLAVYFFKWISVYFRGNATTNPFNKETQIAYTPCCSIPP